MPTPPVPVDSRGTRTTASADGIDFCYPHAPGLTGVRLELDFPIEPTDPEFRLVGSTWVLSLPRPAVDRLEYQFTVRTAGNVRWTTDPGNPDTVPNPFGDKSEIRFPRYRAPEWLSTPDTGARRPVPTTAGALDAPVPTTLWSPTGLLDHTPAPLLLVHDGSDMAERGSLLRWAAQAAQQQPLRIALLDPVSGQRDQWYAANSAYTDQLATVLLPALHDRVEVSATIGMGASLGALAMLFAQRVRPELFDAVMLQSGSYFSRRFDPQESGYERFDHICTAVSLLLAGPARRPCPVLMTCGAVEENRANNEAMAAALTAQGYDVRLDLVRDAHTMIGWRDAWSPGLSDLIDAVGRPGPHSR